METIEDCHGDGIFGGVVERGPTLGERGARHSAQLVGKQLASECTLIVEREPTTTSGLVVGVGVGERVANGAMKSGDEGVIRFAAPGSLHRGGHRAAPIGSS